MKLNTIEEALDELRQGKFVIVVDDEDRENEGDFIIAAQMITPEKVNFMLQHGRGVLCCPITERRCAELDLMHQVANNTSMLGTPFTVTEDKLDRRLCGRQSGYYSGVGRPEQQTGDFRSSGAYQSALCTNRWSTATGRTYRSRRRSGAVSRFLSCRGTD